MALEMLTEAGASVTFQTGTPGTHAPSTGLFTSPTATTVAGQAVEVRPSRAEQDQYRLAGATLDRVVTLWFVPTTFGEAPVVGARVTWAGEVVTVRGVTRIAPDGSGGVAFRVWAVR